MSKRLILNMDEVGRLFIQFHVKLDEKETGTGPQDVFIDFYVSFDSWREFWKSPNFSFLTVFLRMIFLQLMPKVDMDAEDE